MIILGIDPSLKATGYGFIKSTDRNLTVLEAGTIEPKRNDVIQNKLGSVYKHLNDLITQYKPDVMVLEKLYTHAQRTTVATSLGHVRGVICLLCYQQNIELAEFSVKRIRKALVGNGAATKTQTRSMVAHELNIDESKLTLDASDALALALGFFQLNRQTV